MGMATANIIAGSSYSDFIRPDEPSLLVPMQYSFWLLAAMELAVGLMCLLRLRTDLKSAAVLWLAAHLLYWHAPQHDLTGYLAGMEEAFGVPADRVKWVLWTICLYLLLGSGNVLFWLCAKNREDRLSTSCIHCGVRFTFPKHSCGTKIGCPKCAATIILQTPVTSTV